MSLHNRRRRSVRLRQYDYSSEGAYFITICVDDGLLLLGDVVNGSMVMGEVGKIAERCWLQIPIHFPAAKLGAFIIMPNHLHGIIKLRNMPPPRADGTHAGGVCVGNVGANNYSPLQSLPSSITLPSSSHLPNNDNPSRPRGTSKTIGSIVRGFKIGVTKKIGYSIWQRNYFEHIIRSLDSYYHIERYINNNPMSWDSDKLFVEKSNNA
jgi:REP element-mobilizing transposase RayT